MRVKWLGLALAASSATGFFIVGTLGVPSANADIAQSVHNLGATGNGAGPNGGARNQFSGTAEICVFCHTPHGGDANAAVPLWNRQLKSPSSYQTYDQLGTSTLDAKVAPVGSVSLGCLSCHDGTLGLDALINEPGSGARNSGFNGGTWSGADVSGPARAATIRAGVVQNLGTDLTNDHPIGMQYGGGGLSSAVPILPQGGTRDPDFAPVKYKMENGRYFWWVDKDWRIGGDGERTKTDVVLYTRDANSYAGQTNPEPFVECASCHDPHTTENPTFLRISNTDTPSGLCLTCHVK